MSQYSWLKKWQTPQGRRWLWFLFFERLIRIVPYPNWRSLFLKWGGAYLSDDAFIHDVIFQNVYSNGFSNLKLGSKATIQTQCILDLADKIMIEANVTIAAGVKIFTHEDCGVKLGKPLAAYFPRKQAPVVIKQGAWIGAGATILCGVTIGECSVIGAGSLVTKDTNPWTVNVGIPCKEIKKIKGE